MFILMSHNILWSNTPLLSTKGKISQEDGPIRRFKWGTTSLIERATLSNQMMFRLSNNRKMFWPAHLEKKVFRYMRFHEVMPEKYLFGRRPPLPLVSKDIRVIVGQPIEFNLPELRHSAIFDEAAQRWLYTNISERIWSALEGFTWSIYNI
ncbi:hypothetical protein AQUCO_02700418v1 [Aquilegia coerulea]|uniref:Tafazzin family protein n=1 Tax=Aquilegia coerulea TaxID=218851 RepID=A0A2G5D6U0_AQUCA|nr:hypothetical protein AQUCO_02700418v1 [Aquilegia coerulea]